MATALSSTFTTRERFRADFENALLRGVAEATTDGAALQAANEGDDVSNIPILTRAKIDGVLIDLFREPLPPPDEKAAEIRTPGFVNVWAKCPNCGIHLAIPLSVTPQLVLGLGVGELKLKTQSKGRIHACNQLTIEEPLGQMRTFEADSQAGSDVEDLSEPATVATPGMVQNALLAIMEVDESPSWADIQAWDQVTLELVYDWAQAVNAGADVIPEKPAILVRVREAGADEPTSVGRKRKPKTEPETE